MNLSVLELCAGGGGQALGFEMAGFDHAAVVEYEEKFCGTLRGNRPEWKVHHKDIREFSGGAYRGVDLITAGVPCPPFSVAGKQLGSNDERDMFPAALEIIASAKPRAIMFENVPGLAAAKFAEYRDDLFQKIRELGYEPEGRLIQSADYGVPQLRPRFIIIGMAIADWNRFAWPIPTLDAKSVGETLVDLMGAEGWKGAKAWAKRANVIAPTLVGGSRLHGGPDLGPTRAKAQWRTLGVDGMGIANSAPPADAPKDFIPKLTLRMAARIQSFPDYWEFFGGKTAAYRQIGNAFPPKVAQAFGLAIRAALKGEKPVTWDSADQMRLLEKPKAYKHKRMKAAK
ncbi:DNA (cytosine-5-)-methyltransferase [Prosthecobacter sp.]|uniref:DNA cytosine methyltransferase n=1 Tax=Prosthecobacter sp. TaxID=1965333 RepID=UPI001D54197D|nr:DNA (cytosine-5-)-methyltransferase [Prosthecobacter sp.]MCB1276164.1 DNA (cytosine-5-)-methyltransferase [Prosthecobacter sp.]